MRLIKDHQFIEDIYRHIPDSETVYSSDESVILPLELFLAKNNTFQSHTGSVGVLLSSDNKIGEDVRLLVDYLDILSVVLIDFPTFRNGRGYSSARILRDELGFKKDIRAVGDVSYDQWHYMFRCGINSFEVSDDITLEQFTNSLSTFSASYQPASNDGLSIPWRRHPHSQE